MSNPSIVTPPTLTPQAESWSEVRANGQVMRYRRCGVGRAVLVLRPEEQPDALWPELLGALGPRVRLLVPEQPEAAADVTARLAAFLDGLGASGVAVLAAGRLCIPALELALLGGDQVARLALVADGPADLGGTGLDGTLVTTACPPVPLLVVRRALPADDATAVLTRFLEAV
jgi:hypothetical protein